MHLLSASVSALRSLALLPDDSMHGANASRSPLPDGTTVQRPPPRSRRTIGTLLRVRQAARRRTCRRWSVRAMTSRGVL
ncbi:hypothetical protein [Actinomadura meridiana]|uniref:hypothetical protein n=1 Tax=Actinomadura meridiana TaxID=559626 RepID=UPI0031E5D199